MPTLKKLTNEVSCVKRHPHNLSIEREVHMSCYTQLTQEEGNLYLTRTSQNQTGVNKLQITNHNL